MDTKLFIAQMTIKCGKVVASDDYNNIISDNPVAYAKNLSENNADRIFITDLSVTDDEHDEAIGIIKQICLTCEIPVIGTGHIFRMEDVKKLLYAGCAHVVINFENETEKNITDEVSHKFGKDKIIAMVNSLTSYNANKEIIAALCSRLILTSENITTSSIADVNVPVIIMHNASSFESMYDYLENIKTAGITGEFINSNITEITSYKHTCYEKNIPVITFEGADDFSTFKLNSDGMIPVVVQDYKTFEVLQVAYMNREAYEHTLLTGKMTYYSRTRQELWIKGETSGHYQYVKELHVDCDRDTILAKVSQVGAACHTGKYSCFFNELGKKDYDDTNPLKVFTDVYNVILDRKVNPKEGSYTNYLFDKGIDKILKKLGEEATEIVIAAKNPNPDEIKYEISDFLYHMMVLMAEKNVTWEEITNELARR